MQKKKVLNILEFLLKQDEGVNELFEDIVKSLIIKFKKVIDKRGQNL